MSRRPLQIWVFQGAGAQEPATLKQTLAQHGEVIWAAMPASGTELVKWLAASHVLETSLPDCILFLPAYPKQLTRELVDQLRSWAPLAQLISIAGPWSEGEVRTGPLPTGVRRLLWQECDSRLREWLRSPAIHAPHYRPATEQGVDPWLVSSRLKMDSASGKQALPVVVISCPTLIDFQTWSESLLPEARSIWLRPDEEPANDVQADVLVWCFGTEIVAETPLLEKFSRRLAAKRLVALTHFVRPDESHFLATLFPNLRLLSLPVLHSDLRSAVLGDLTQGGPLQNAIKSPIQQQ